MTKAVVVEQEASDELREGAAWYEQDRAGVAAGKEAPGSRTVATKGECRRQLGLCAPYGIAPVASSPPRAGEP
jgi:hypothetical protein